MIMHYEISEKIDLILFFRFSSRSVSRSRSGSESGGSSDDASGDSSEDASGGSDGYDSDEESDALSSDASFESDGEIISNNNVEVSFLQVTLFDRKTVCKEYFSSCSFRCLCQSSCKVKYWNF